MLMCRSYYDSPKLTSCLAIDCLLAQRETTPPCLSSSSSTTSTSSSSTSLNLNESDSKDNSNDRLKTYSIKKNSFIFNNVKKNVCISNAACTSSSSECLSSDEGYVGSYSDNYYEINKINKNNQNLVNIMSSNDKSQEENGCFQIPALFVQEETIESTGLICSDELDLCEKCFPKMDDVNVFATKVVLYDDLASSFPIESLIEIEQLCKKTLNERMDADKKDETDMASSNWRQVVEKRQICAAKQGELFFEDQCDLNAYLKEIDMNLDYSQLDQIYLDSSNANTDLDQCLKFSHNKMAFNLRKYHEYLLGERSAKKSLFANIQVDSIAEFVPVLDNESYTYEDKYQLEANEYEMGSEDYTVDDVEYTMIESDELQESAHNFLIDTTVIAHNCDDLELSPGMDYDGVEYEDYEDQIYIDSLTEEEAILLLRSESEVYALQMSQAAKYGLLDDSCQTSCKKTSQKTRFDSGQTDDLSKADIFDNVFNYDEHFDHEQFDYSDEIILNEENYSNLSVSLRNSLLDLRKSRRHLARLLDENSKKINSGCASTGASSTSSSFSASHIGLYKQHLANQSKKPCMYMLTEGRCLRSDCRFVHDFKTITCKYWLEGECLKGESCEFLHEIVECEKSSKSQAKKAKKEAKAKKDFKLDTEEFPALGLSSDKPKQSSPKTKNQSMANVVKKNAHKKENESIKMVKEEKQKNAKQKGEHKARSAKNSSTPVIQITIKPNKQQAKKSGSNSCGTSLASSGSSSTTSSRANSKVRAKK